MSRQIDFTIDEHGNLTSADFGGFVGPECEAVQKLIEKYTGRAAKSTRKPEYNRVQTKPTITIQADS